MQILRNSVISWKGKRAKFCMNKVICQWLGLNDTRKLLTFPKHFSLDGGWFSQALLPRGVVRMAGATCQIIASSADASPPRTDGLASAWANAVANEAQRSRNPPSASASVGGGRAIVIITDVQANYKVATPESGGSEVLYVRKTSMRDRAAWSGLRVGNRVDLAFRLAAGRAIVSDAVPA